MNGVPDSGQKFLVILGYICCKPWLILNQIKDLFRGKSIITREQEITERVLWTEFWKYNKKIKKAKTDAERDEINFEYGKLFEAAQEEIKALKK